MLESDDLEYELGNKLQQADMNGVQSIPFYIVNVSAPSDGDSGSDQDTDHRLSVRIPLTGRCRPHERDRSHQSFLKMCRWRSHPTSASDELCNIRRIV